MSLKDTKFRYYSGSSSDLATSGYKTAASKTHHLKLHKAVSANQKNAINSAASVAYNTEDRWSVSGGSYGPSSTRSADIDGKHQTTRTVVSDGFTSNNVAPAASRRRQRGSVTSVFGGSGYSGSGYDSSTTSSVCWSEETFTVRQVADLFNDQWPVIVRTCSCYSGHSDGDHDLELTFGQVLQVYADSCQTRLYAISNNGRQMSLPYDLPISVRPRTASGLGSLMRLCDAVSHNPNLPLTLSVVGLARSHPVQNAAKVPTQQPVDSNNGLVEIIRRHQLATSSSTFRLSEIENQLTGTDLTITSVYQCRMLVAHVIRDDWLEGRRRVLIPEDLGVELKIATGLERATAEEWKDYCGMFARSARHLSLQHVDGYKGLYYLDWSGQQPPVAVTADNDRLNVDSYKIDTSTSSSTVRSRDQSADPPAQRPLPPYRPAPDNVSITGANHRKYHQSPETKSTTGQTSVNCSPVIVRPKLQTSNSSSSSSISSLLSLCGKPEADRGVVIEMERRDSAIPSKQAVRFAETEFGRRCSDPAVAPTLPPNHTATGDGMTSFPPTNYPRMGKREMMPESRRKSSCPRIIGSQLGGPDALQPAIPSSNSKQLLPASFGGSMPSLVGLQLGQPADKPLKPSFSNGDRLAQRLSGRDQRKARVQFSIDSSTGSGIGVPADSSLLDAGLVDDGYCTKDSSTSVVSNASSNGCDVRSASSSRLIDMEIGSVYF